ncbi:M15 family metallopeptidase [Christensenellaceae bacterium OttesenSCG-928-K19]|nr:M15 family metallopeptidase [Christensenellaceae bacterium OttesenSCG-928-K19]
MTNKPTRYIILIVLATALLFFVPGCTQSAAPTPEETTVTSTVAPTQTPSPTPSPTPTQTPSPTPSPTPTPTPTPEGMIMVAEGFTAQPIPEEIYERMLEKSYPEDCPIPLEELRYLRVLHIGFDGENHEGEMVVNVQIAEDVLHIMKALYDNEYPIEKMALIDDYDANDERSMTDNNSSAFCYRVVKGTNTLSNHARGLAVDINPLYNPYVRGGRVEPEAAQPYVDRSQDNPYFLRSDDLCVQLFKEYGFTWGGDWNGYKDYQHFDIRD